MRLSWNEIRARAARFAEEWAGASYEKGEAQSFYNDFFDVFGVKRRRIASFEEPVKLLGDKRGFIDLFWKGVLLVEQKSAGGSLKRAKTQALEYFPGLKDAELPRYVLVSDFQTFELHDLDEGTVEPFALARIGFVATNSITQGEQVAQLWPLLFDRYGLEIAFAHRTFAWGSDAKGKAHVHVVILGLTKPDDEPQRKRLFSYDDIEGDPHESRHTALSPYLFDASLLADRHLVVKEVARPLGSAPKLATGTQPIDDGNYIFDDVERVQFLATEPGALPLLRPFVGGEEYINGGTRWILCFKGVEPSTLRGVPQVTERMRLVRAFRRKSKRASTKAIADYPEKYNVELIPNAPFLCVPEVSSERREYVPIGWLEPPVIPSNKIRALVNADLWQFGILTSRMHMVWTAYVGGRLESRYQYSVGINYNAFPWPDAEDAARESIRALAQDVLDARAAHPGQTLADLYDPDVMPTDLRRAHRALDLAVERLYRPSPFTSDRERVEHLFALYEKLVAPLAATATKPKVKRKAGGQ